MLEDLPVEVMEPQAVVEVLEVGEIYYSEGDYDFYIEKKKQRDKDIDQSKPNKEKADSRIKPKINPPRRISFKDALELNRLKKK